MKAEYPQIRKAAKGQHCTVRLPGVCMAPNRETTVAAHIHDGSNGIGLKVGSDLCVVFACMACHDVIDGRCTAHTFIRSELVDYVLRGYQRTIKKLVELGVLRVC